jgi:hypothetical protein
LRKKTYLFSPSSSLSRLAGPKHSTRAYVALGRARAQAQSAIPVDGQQRRRTPFQATRRRRNPRNPAPTPHPPQRAVAIDWARIRCPTAPLVPAPSRRCSERGLLAPLPSSPGSSGTNHAPWTLGLAAPRVASFCLAAVSGLRVCVLGGRLVSVLTLPLAYAESSNVTEAWDLGKLDSGTSIRALGLDESYKAITMM